MVKTGIVYHENYLKHDTGDHPESNVRLITIMGLLEETGALERLISVHPKKATIDQVRYVHGIHYIEELRSSCQKGVDRLDLDTIISSDSYDVALLAAGGVLSAVDMVIKSLDNAFALIRPPGHHAESDRGGGFCLFNNIAIATRHVQLCLHLDNVLIIDWDVHHGNGTQNIFYDDPSVLYFSTHQSPLYPGTGSIEEVGFGDGKGFTVNVPLPVGTGDTGYFYVFNEVLAPIATEFKPDFILISAGEDAHFADPLGGMRLTAKGFGFLTNMVKMIASHTCKGRIVAALEGGYDLTGLSYSILSILNSLGDLGIDVKEPKKIPKDDLSDQLRNRVREVKKVQAEYWDI
ncbi:MAG: histone deacetylase [Methanocellales archaeon]|nr:histone deacetylase [Methanocellales archaeon]